MNKTVFPGQAGRPGRLWPILFTMSFVGGCMFGGPDSASEALESLAVPDDEGMYANLGEELVRLDGDPEWERETWPHRANLPGTGVFTIRDLSVAASDKPFTDVIGLRKVAWVRSEITEAGRARPVSGSRWQAVAAPTLEIPLEFKRSEDGDPEVVHVKPAEPLEPGLYSLFLDTGAATRKARFGVNWPDTDKQAYASTVCVDRVAGAAGGYRPCATPDSTSGDPSGEPLKIVLASPEIESGGGSRTMVVKGLVRNESGSSRDVPPLSGELRSDNGDVLARWQFRATLSRLEPGQSASFRSELRGVPPRVRNVHVDFDTAHASTLEN